MLTSLISELAHCNLSFFLSPPYVPARGPISTFLLEPFFFDIHTHMRVTRTAFFVLFYYSLVTLVLLYLAQSMKSRLDHSELSMAHAHYMALKRRPELCQNPSAHWQRRTHYNSSAAALRGEQLAQAVKVVFFCILEK